MSKTKIQPFSCGSQYADWTSRNCDRCKKQTPIEGFEKSNKFICEIEEILSFAYFDDGLISKEIAKRMGYVEDFYTWKCPERELIQQFPEVK